MTRPILAACHVIHDRPTRRRRLTDLRRRALGDLFLGPSPLIEHGGLRSEGQTVDSTRADELGC